jgi:predicted TIM-barrel fold metal-dependent hydrolase
MSPSTPTRRTVLAAGALLPAGAALAADAGPPPPVIDAHVHCFDGKASKKFPYHEKAPYRPVPVATPERLLECMDGAGVGQAVIVHPEPYQDDHSYLKHCLAIGRGRLKGTCLFFPDRPGWDKALPELVKAGGIVAVRIHAYAPERLPPFGKPELRAFWKTAADLGLVVQLHFEPHYAAGFEPLIKAYSRTPVLIDNLGRPLQATSDEYDRVLRWARLPNTYMKLSGMPPEGEYPFRDVAPIIKQLVGAYGPSRVVWGGGYGPGVTPASYRAAREAIRAHYAYLTPAEQDEILGGTASKLFRF